MSIAAPWLLPLLLPTVAAEAALAKLLARDPRSAERLAGLESRRLRVHLAELPAALTVTVHGQGLWLNWLDEEAVDCTIRSRLAVLPELRDSANITRLIKADQLDIEGDPLLAQRISQLLTSLQVDWQSWLAEHLGDVPAHWLSQAWQRSRAQLQGYRTAQRDYLQQQLFDEQQLLATPLAFADFKAALQQLRAQVDRLERQIKQQTAWRGEGGHA